MQYLTLEKVVECERFSKYIINDYITDEYRLEMKAKKNC